MQCLEMIRFALDSIPAAVWCKERWDRVEQTTMRRKKSRRAQQRQQNEQNKQNSAPKDPKSPNCAPERIILQPAQPPLHLGD